MEWYNIGRGLDKDTLQTNPGFFSRSQAIDIRPVSLKADFPKPYVMAADPVGFVLFTYPIFNITQGLLPDSLQFTSDAYKDRTSYPCSDLSFAAVAEGSLPSFSIDVIDNKICNHIIPKTSDIQEVPGVEESQCLIEMVICSFALHLIETPSNLFTLLWQLSLKARWLIILAPHKKPEVLNLPYKIFVHKLFLRSRMVGVGVNGTQINGLAAKCWTFLGSSCMKGKFLVPGSIRLLL